MGAKIAAAAIAIGVGVACAFFTPLGYVIAAVAGLCLATLAVERLAVAIFWVLPYMIVAVPTGVFTLKAPELTMYAFALAATLRAILRKDKWILPPATPQVLVFLAVCLISTAFEPNTAIPFYGNVKPQDRNAPGFRSISEIMWMAIGWLVVVALYNIINKRRDLFRRCVIAHCYGGGIASIISVVLLVCSLLGLHLDIVTGGGRERSATSSGSLFRLSGVAYEPLFLAFYLATVIPTTLVVFLFRSEWASRKLLRAALLWQCIVMFLTFSAGGMLGLVFSILIVAALLASSVPTSLWRKMRTVGIVTIVVGGTAFVAIQGLIAQVESVFSKVLDPEESSRAVEWTTGLAEFTAYPILGVGPGMSTYQWPRFSPQSHSQSIGGVRNVNDIVLSTLAETGIIGLIAVLVCVVAGLKPYIDTIARYGPARVPILVALTASLVGCAVQTLSMPLETLSLFYLSATIALSAVAYRVEPMVSVSGETA